MDIASEKPGYKKTKLGWIPEEWEIVSLGGICRIINGRAYKQAELLTEGKYKVLRVGNLFTNDNWYYSDLELDEDKYVNDGDLMYAWSASFGPHFWTDEKTIYHYHIWKIEVDTEADKNFLYHFFNADAEKIQNSKQGGTMAHITKGVMEKRKLPLPPLPEQRAIAAVLATWDRAIDFTRRLVETKKARQKGLMQQLLSGKKRLDGFEGEWIRVKAGEIFESVSKKGFEDEELLSVTQDYGVIPRSSLEARVTMPSGNTKSFKLVEPGNFVISLRSFQGGLEFSKYRGVVSPAYTVLEPSKEIEDAFYRHYFKSYDFIGHLAVAVIGIRDGKQISYQDFCIVKIPFPTIEEQRAIAAVLSRGEAEIKQSEQYLTTLQQQKKGLMQKLLTGEVRVNV